MKIGEVCLQTNDVVQMADFYRWLLGIKDDNKNSAHQTIIADETMLTIYNDGTINMSFYDPDRNVIYLRQFTD